MSQQSPPRTTKKPKQKQSNKQIHNPAKIYSQYQKSLRVRLSQVDLERIPTADLVDEEERHEIGVNTTNHFASGSRNSFHSVNGSQDSNPLKQFEKLRNPPGKSMEPIKLQSFSFEKGGHAIIKELDMKEPQQECSKDTVEVHRSYDEIDLEPIEAPYYGIMGASSTKFSNFKYETKPKSEKPLVMGKQMRILSAPAARSQPRHKYISNDLKEEDELAEDTDKMKELN